MDPVLLARFQFAMTVMVHFIFPAVSIGLGLLVAVLETMRWRTRRDDRREVYDKASVFWTKLFALTFVCGAATGIVMEFQFGTNWSAYSKFVGDIFGAPLAAEGVLAFFLESVFLGLLVYGRDRISSGVRWFAALMVAVGATLSAFWIIVADSFMQTPAGYELVGDRAHLTDFLAAVFNPSTLPRYTHTVVAAWCVGGFLMVAVSAWYVLRRRHAEVARLGLRLGLALAFLATVFMFVTGDQSSRQVASTQPAKFAAMQGLYQTTAGVPLTIFALPPGQNPQGVDEGPAIQITRLVSFLTVGDFQGVIRGLSAFPPDQWPPVAMTFLAYHNMVALGTFMALVVIFGLFYLWRGSITRHRTWLWIAVIAPIAPLLATQLGWATAEIGRQPWIVYGLMRTEQGVSPAVDAGMIVFSIGLLAVIYALLLVFWVYVMAREVVRGPADASVFEDETEAASSPTLHPQPAA